MGAAKRDDQQFYDIRKVGISGITKDIRRKNMESQKADMEKQNYLLIDFVDNGIFGSYANFGRTEPLPKMEKLWRFAAKTSIAVIIFAGIGSCIYAGLNTGDAVSPSDHANWESTRKAADARLVAVTVKKLLRSNGVSEALIIDVKSESDATITFVVTNAWLAAPDYEQSQNRMTLQEAVRRTYPPNGLPIRIVDFQGTQIWASSLWGG